MAVDHHRHVRPDTVGARPRRPLAGLFPQRLPCQHAIAADHRVGLPAAGIGNEFETA
ncbi:Uncharacterised protein [Bordetella pertussis]|nr:Uncharacterised protein [Bordetella pertussis]